MAGWWDRIKHHSLGWVGARDGCEWLNVDFDPRTPPKNIRLAGRLAGRNRSLTVALPPQYVIHPSTPELWFTLAE
ncbi:hypothetical protein [Streptomyces niger]|uniref:hypothetical protein n=1 Tax=Streptomyces niger TaxID=66373 RepID=UPI001F1EEEEC|nr:hypothetical protein [Streptomyces niger]